MTDIDIAAWREGIVSLRDPEVSEAIVVQCDTAWLQPSLRALRNELDEALELAQLRRASALVIHRVILHSLPITTRPPTARARALDAAFEDWNHRLATTVALLHTEGRPAPRVHRLIIRGNQTRPPLPDMFELAANGRWENPQLTESALGLIRTNTNTTPLTTYDVDLDGPFGDIDPSVHM